jgi:hypothetical protein
VAASVISFKSVVKKNLSRSVRGRSPKFWPAFPLGDCVNRGEQIRLFLRKNFLRTIDLWRKPTTNEHPPSREATAGRLMNTNNGKKDEAGRYLNQETMKPRKKKAGKRKRRKSWHHRLQMKNDSAKEKIPGFVASRLKQTQAPDFLNQETRKAGKKKKRIGQNVQNGTKSILISLVRRFHRLPQILNQETRKPRKSSWLRGFQIKT